MKRVTALFVAILMLPPAALAQQRPAPSETEKPTSAESIDLSKLGVSLARIRRELDQPEAKEQGTGGPLKFEFKVEVFGTAPRYNLLENFPLTGPVPYGGPTHRDVLEFLTPEEFKSPPLPFSTLAFWAAQQLWNRSKKQRCEQELAEYKALVMQGVSVAAPRCTQ